MTSAILVQDDVPRSLRSPEAPRGRRRDLPPDSGTILRLSLVYGCLTGLASGTLLTTFLGLADLPGGGGSATLLAVILVAGLGSCALLRGLMNEARSAALHQSIGGNSRAIPVRRRAELLRRALSGLALRVGILLALGALVLFGLGSRLEIPWSSLPRIDREAVSYLATLMAVGGTLALGEILFRLSSREGRVDHAPWILVPSILGMALGASGLLP